MAARVAHNHEVVGSSPTPATMKNDRLFVGLFSCWVWLGSATRQLAGDSRRFGGARQSAKARFEHWRAEEAKGRCPTPATK